VDATKIHFEEQVLVASIKQSKQANKAGRLDGAAESPCFVSCLLQAPAIPSGFLTN
jgi:hypothetical protein